MRYSNSYQTFVVCSWVILITLLGFPALTNGAVKESKIPQTARSAVTLQTFEQVRRSDLSKPTGSVRTFAGQRTIELDISMCRDIVDLAVSLGYNPPRRCGGELDHGATSATPVTQDPPEQSSSNVEREDVLLVHGFSVSANHDCDVYWGAQEEVIEEVGSDGNTARQAITIGWYGGNTNCEVNLSDGFNPGFNVGTPLIDVARELKLWIVDNYTTYGKSVDIVAHSLGGIVVRLMLEQWGQELLVSDVVTLGTPHAGVQTLLLAPVCGAIGQCKQVEAGGEFITNLEHNPQSTITTQWTLIAAANDQVVGKGTGVAMESNGGPEVNRYEYAMHHKYGCSPIFGAFSSIGHNDLQGDNASFTVHECNVWGFSVDTVANPTTRMLNALD